MGNHITREINMVISKRENKIIANQTKKRGTHRNCDQIFFCLSLFLFSHPYPWTLKAQIAKIGPDSLNDPTSAHMGG